MLTYLQKKTERREELDFESAIQPKVVSSRIKANLPLSYDYVGFSRYYSSVKAYLDRFDHDAVFNTAEGRIEMYLISRCDQQVPIEALDINVSFTEGERIQVGAIM